MKVKVEDLTIKQFIKSMNIPEIREQIEGRYDSVWVEKIASNRVCIDGIFDTDTEIEVSVENMAE